VLAAFLSIQDPRERPADARQAADQAHAPFADPKSDFISVLNLWHAHALAHEELTQSKLRDWCRDRFLSYLRMREWRELHRQLLLMQPGADSRESGIEETGIDNRKSGSAGAASDIPPVARSGAVAATTADPRAPTTARKAAKNVRRSKDPAEPAQAGTMLDPGVPIAGLVDYEAVHRCLLSGWPTQVGIRDERS